MARHGSDHHETLYEAETPMPSERSTGIVFAVVFAVLALFFRADPWWFFGALTISTAFAGLALFAPSMLKTLTRLWFAFALLLNRVMSPLIMLVIYCVAIVPFGAVLRLRADPLRAKRDDTAESYWIARTPNPKSSMRDQF